MHRLGRLQFGVYIILIGFILGSVFWIGSTFNSSGQIISALKEKTTPMPTTAGSTLFYNASWNCFHDEVGSTPSHWIDNHPGYGSLEVVNEYNGHYHPIKLTDTSASGGSEFYRNFSVTQTSGFIEYWLYSQGGICAYLAGRSNQTIAFSLHQAYGTWYVCDIDTGISISFNKWIHVQISFSAGQGTFVVDGVQIAQTAWMNGISSINNLFLASGATVETGSSYYDAIGLSWLNYQPGDNEHGIVPPTDFPLTLFLIVLGIAIAAGISVVLVFLISNRHRQSVESRKIPSRYRTGNLSEESYNITPMTQRAPEFTRRFCTNCGSSFSQENVARFLMGNPIKCEFCGHVLRP